MLIWFYIGSTEYCPEAPAKALIDLNWLVGAFLCSLLHKIGNIAATYG
jgi:hypothetical protein